MLCKKILDHDFGENYMIAEICKYNLIIYVTGFYKKLLLHVMKILTKVLSSLLSNYFNFENFTSSMFLIKEALYKRILFISSITQKVLNAVIGNEIFN